MSVPKKMSAILNRVGKKNKDITLVMHLSLLLGLVYCDLVYPIENCFAIELFFSGRGSKVCPIKSHQLSVCELKHAKSRQKTGLKRKLSAFTDSDFAGPTTANGAGRFF